MARPPGDGPGLTQAQCSLRRVPEVIKGSEDGHAGQGCDRPAGHAPKEEHKYAIRGRRLSIIPMPRSGGQDQHNGRQATAAKEQSAPAAAHRSCRLPESPVVDWAADRRGESPPSAESIMAKAAKMERLPAENDQLHRIDAPGLHCGWSTDIEICRQKLLKGRATSPDQRGPSGYLGREAPSSPRAWGRASAPGVSGGLGRMSASCSRSLPQSLPEMMDCARHRLTAKIVRSLAIDEYGTRSRSTSARSFPFPPDETAPLRFMMASLWKSHSSPPLRSSFIFRPCRRSPAGPNRSLADLFKQADG